MDDSSEPPEDFNIPAQAFLHHGMRRSNLQLEDARYKLETNWHSQIHLDGEVARSLSSTRQQTPFNTIQSIPYPKQYLNPTTTMSIDMPSSSSLHQLKTNQHSQIHSDGEGERSLSLARRQTPFNTIQPFFSPKRYVDPTTNMSIDKPSSSGLHQLKTNQHSQIHLDGEGKQTLSLARRQTPFNTIQPVSNPKQYMDPTTIMSIEKPSSSCLHQLITNQHSQIYSDGEGERSLSLARSQTPFNTVLPVSNPKRYMDPAPIMSITKPSSSGLQLKNFFNSGGMVNVKPAQMGSFSMQERKCKPLFDLEAETLAREITGDHKLANGSNYKSLLSAYLVKSSNKSVVLNPIKDQSTQADKNNRNAENAGDEEEFYRSNTETGRIQISESICGDSRILSCQCKKINCLKLYCKCFAAGLYCTATCSCQGCINVKKHDDEVLEAREQIESRKPMAFAPKVFQHSIEPSASGYGGDGTRLSPSSSRPIRRCNCKKSKCLKKYCDCYQSEVGCSDGCRCEGCQNVYGQKREKGIIMKGPLSGEQNNQRTIISSDCFHTVAPTNGTHNTYLGTDQHSTPLSLLLLHSNQEKDESNTLLSIEYFLMSPDPTLHLDNNDSIPETAKEILDQLSSDQVRELGNAETMDECEFPVPPFQKPEETGISSGLPNNIEWSNSSAPLFPSGSSHYYRASSPCWPGSRISPVPDFRGTQLDQVVAHECELHNILNDYQPETLEYPPISLNNVKVSSQNEKQVPPPHDPVQEFGSSSQVGLLNQFSHPRCSR